MTKKEAQRLFVKTHFYNDTFNMFYHFTNSREEFERMMEWIGQENQPINIGGRCVSAVNDGEIRIWVGLFNDDLATLAHECTHASLFTLEAIGQKLDYGDEVSAYLVGYIFRECQKKMDKEMMK